MLIVFHGKYSTINPLWHIRHLGKYRQETRDVYIVPSDHHQATYTYSLGLPTLGVTLATPVP